MSSPHRNPAARNRRRRSCAARYWETEDARDASPAGLASIQEALKSKDNETRRVAVRALGRLEQPALAASIASSLADPAPVVRSEGANALAQTAGAGADLALVEDLLLGQLERESHPLVRGALALSLGRLPYKTPEAVRKAEQAIVATLKASPPAGVKQSERAIPMERQQFASPLTLLGGLRGVESLARLHAAKSPLEPATLTLLRELAVAWRSAVARSEGGPTAEAAARLRRLAMAALVSATGADANTISTAFGDADDQVRRLAAQAAALTEPLDTKLVERAVRDQSPVVRAEIALALGRREHPGTCGYAGLLLRDPSSAVAVSALDVAGRACAGNAAVTAAVAAIANQLPPPPLPDVDAQRRAAQEGGTGVFGLTSRGTRAGVWQSAAHAIVALARLAPDTARERLDKFASDTRWHVRMYAARAAALARQESVLKTLAQDPHDNVREAAAAGLREVSGHEADDVFVDALGRKDYQLLITAARALEGSQNREPVTNALFDALDRVTGEKRDTSRDTRKALLDRIEELGGAASASRLEAFLQDFDPVIADRSAAILSKWKGTAVKATPRRLPRPALPSTAELDTLSTARVAIRIRDVGRFELKLLVQEAPLNAWRFYRLARQNYFDGLTIHRVVPNFVLQGGSPGANEYMGDGPYTRDEVGLQSNLRGTLGISTRGRDTGDGQVFINLVDNMRLDHNYTVFAQIERGIEVIDAIIEGDVIEDVEVSPAR